jgi:hypothetical protein
MGPHGQLSRITSPISLVTHALIPFPSAPGQLSLAQVHQARHLIGQLPARVFEVEYKEVVETLKRGRGKAVVRAFNAGFSELGFPYCAKMGEKVVVNGNVKVGERHGNTEVFVVDTQKSSESDKGLLGDMCRQYESWTGRSAPVSIMADALRYREE